MGNEIILYGDWDIEQSKIYMKSLCDNLDLKIRCKHEDIIDQKFGEKIDLRKTLRGNFYNCCFTKSRFDNFDCSDYFFSSCEFLNCTIENSNFSYLGAVDYTNCKNTILINSSFDYSILEDVTFEGLLIKACHLGCSTIKNCTINNVNVNCSDFVGSIIENSTITNIELNETDIQYVEFSNVKASGVTFLIEDILHCFNGIDMIEKNKHTVKLRLFDTSRKISGDEFINSLRLMMPYLYSINDYFSLANICMYYGESQKAFEYILLGLKYNLEQRDFKVIRYFCKLATSTPLFSYKDLKTLYQALESNEISSNLTRFEYRRYINELAEIKHILIENPSAQIQMNITIKTLIDEYDYNKLMYIIQAIDVVANEVIPQTQKSVSIRHNSSPVIDIILNGQWENLVPFFATLCAVLGCSIKYIKQIYDVLILKETLYVKKINNKIKTVEYEEHLIDLELKKRKLYQDSSSKSTLIQNFNKAEHNYSDLSSKIQIDGSEVSNISYSLKFDANSIPNEIRQMNFDINVKHS